MIVQRDPEGLPRREGQGFRRGWEIGLPKGEPTC